MSILGKMMSSVSQLTNSEVDFPNHPQTSPASPIFNKNPADSSLNVQNQNNRILQSVAKNVAANAADEQTDSIAIFKQEVQQVNEQNLSKTADKATSVVFSKPAEQMNYDDYTRDYLRAMLRETGVSNATDAEVDRFQSLLKDATGDGFGVENKVEQARITERYRAAQTKNGGEAIWATSPRGRALVLAGAGAIVRERAAAGAALGQAQTVGQQKAMEMARDAGRVLYNAGVGAIESTINTGIDAAASDMGRNPLYFLPTTPKPHVNLSGAKSEYESELMRRDTSGKVTDNPNVLTAGKVIEKGVEIGGTIAVGKVLSAPAAPQSLELGSTARTTETLVYEADAMAKAGASGRTIIGRRAKADEITEVAQELEAGGIKIVKNADARIDKVNRNAAAAFDFEKGELLLRKDATFLEVFHEKTHAKQWTELGKEKYLELGRLAREEHVYKTITENKHLFSERELDLSRKVIERYRIQKSRGEID